jgi:hypothetical protein
MKEVTDEEAASLRGGAKLTQNVSMSVNVVKNARGPAKWSWVQDVNGKVTHGSGTGNLSLHQEEHISNTFESIDSVQIIDISE